MRRIISLLLVLAIVFAVLSGCAKEENKNPTENVPKPVETEKPTAAVSAETTWENAVTIQLDNETITVDGEPISTDSASAVYMANDIVYYEEGKDFTYGEGTEADVHSQEEADAHTVVHITQPGQYVLSGTLSAGQISVDLGEDAEENPDAVVTLILNGLDITCSVAPAVIFYHVYECGSSDAETATHTVNTTAAGANVMIADGSTNLVNGSYVARIYKPDSVELSEDGTEVADAKKLHKYDAAFYSKMSMNVGGGEQGTGKLYITAENEGLDSELHLTINGGMTYIESGNDGINTNEDYVSVTTINGGYLNIVVTGETGEGDGIDSNGWLVINGGTVQASACSFSGDAGIDSDMGIHINGGTVSAGGNMLDRIEEGGQNFVVFQFTAKQSGGTRYQLKNHAGETVCEWTPVNDFTSLVFSCDTLAAGEYTLWSGDVQLSGFVGGNRGIGGFGGGMCPGGMMPSAQEPPEGMEHPGNMTRPEGMTPPDGMEFPEGMTPPQGMERPGAGNAPGGNREMAENFETTSVFTVTEGGNYITISA